MNTPTGRGIQTWACRFLLAAFVPAIAIGVEAQQPTPGEALWRKLEPFAQPPAEYADKFGVETMCVRIGNYGDKPIDKRRLSIWLSPRDMAQLVRIGLEHPDVHYEIVYGSSHNERAWWDNAAAERLGYRPLDSAEDHRDGALAATAREPEGKVGELFIGGAFCEAEFAGDLDRIR